MGSDGDSGTNRSVSSAPPASDSRPQPDRGGGGPKDEQDQEYLRMLSRALQQPGRSPRAFTAEILDPSAASEAVCCKPRVGTMFTTGNKFDTLRPTVDGDRRTGQ